MYLAYLLKLALWSSSYGPCLDFSDHSAHHPQSRLVLAAWRRCFVHPASRIPERSTPAQGTSLACTSLATNLYKYRRREILGKQKLYFGIIFTSLHTPTGDYLIQGPRKWYR